MFPKANLIQIIQSNKKWYDPTYINIFLKIPVYWKNSFVINWGACLTNHYSFIWSTFKIAWKLTCFGSQNFSPWNGLLRQPAKLQLHFAVAFTSLMKKPVSIQFTIPSNLVNWVFEPAVFGELRVDDRWISDSRKLVTHRALLRTDSIIKNWQHY